MRPPEPRRVLVGSLAAGRFPDAARAAPAGTLLIDLGPDHPSSAGLIELRLWTAAEVIQRAEVVVGFLHRGAEKLFEVRDYRQILMLADRHDWQAPFSGELLIALLAEQLLGIEVPERARWLRTLLAEHTRVLSHLGFLSYVPFRVGAAVEVRPLREALRHSLLRLTGNRIHPMANRVGGLAVDADTSWLQTEQRLLADVRSAAVQLQQRIESADVAVLGRGVARLPFEVITAYGVSGPAARASGVGLDLRRDRPYLAYGELAGLLRPSPYRDGDVQARLATLAHELTVSAEIGQACIGTLRQRPGPVAAKLGKVIRLPEGDAVATVEAPLGLASAFVVSRGEKTPWRLKLRTPSFSNVAALEAVLVGVRVEALEATLASIGYVVGDIDR